MSACNKLESTTLSGSQSTFRAVNSWPTEATMEGSIGASLLVSSGSILASASNESLDTGSLNPRKSKLPIQKLSLRAMERLLLPKRVVVVVDMLVDLMTTVLDEVVEVNVVLVVLVTEVAVWNLVVVAVNVTLLVLVLVMGVVVLVVDVAVKGVVVGLVVVVNVVVLVDVVDVVGEVVVVVVDWVM